jgi:hypothetical protein
MFLWMSSFYFCSAYYDQTLLLVTKSSNGRGDTVNPLLLKTTTAAGIW